MQAILLIIIHLKSYHGFISEKECFTLYTVNFHHNYNQTKLTMGSEDYKQEDKYQIN